MSREEINKRNEAIASFLGWYKNNNWNPFIWNCRDQNNDPVLTIANYERDLKFNYSWDWLMVAVEKIEGRGFDSRILGYNSEGEFLCDFVDFENNEAACRSSSTSKIEAVFLAVSDFCIINKTTTP